MEAALLRGEPLEQRVARQLAAERRRGEVVLVVVARGEEAARGGVGGERRGEGLCHALPHVLDVPLLVVGGATGVRHAHAHVARLGGVELRCGRTEV